MFLTDFLTPQRWACRVLVLAALLLMTSAVRATEWTVMLYMDADNNLERSAVSDFLEMASVSGLTGGATASVRVLVQFDRISGYDSEYGDWTTCKRFELRNKLTPDAANAIADISEVNMGDPATLTSFLNWGTGFAPANRYALILWNHGGGWRSPGPTPTAPLAREVAYDDSSDGDCLYTKEVRQALEDVAIRMDLIGFDACLMGMIEVAYELKAQASVFVASEQNEPGTGWPYATILGGLAASPAASASELGKLIVDCYGSSQDGATATMSAIDLSKVQQLADAVSSFADAVLAATDKDWPVINDSRYAAGCYSLSDFRDLAGFMQGVATNATNPTIKSTAQAVVDLLGNSGVIVRSYSSASDKANGLSIYFQDNGTKMDAAYTTDNILFAEKSWDEFLTQWADATLPPPPNDNFANRIVLTGATPTATGWNSRATKESLEPNHAGQTGGRSVWWSWTAPVNGVVAVSLAGSSFDTLLGVYTGSAVSTLTLVANSDDYGGELTSQATFNAIAGTEYQIAVDGYGGASGQISLSIVMPPANDNFAGRIALVGSTCSTTGTNTYATKESGEPNHASNAGGKSVWWSWTAPANGRVVISTAGTNFDTLLGVYTGSSVSALTAVASNDDYAGASTSQVQFEAVAGTQYLIAIDGYCLSGYEVASGAISLTVTRPATNDDFAGRIALTGSSVSTNGSNSFASKESGEPNHAGNAGGASVWWTWTAPADGSFTISTAGSDFDTLLAVYTGSAVSSLTAVASNDDFGGANTSQVTFDASFGTPYRIAVDGRDGATGSISLGICPTAPPPNDSFANRITLTGGAISIIWSNVNAGKEAGEPNHADNAGGASVWWTWTAPATGPFTISTVGSSFAASIAVYTGSSIAALTSAVSSDAASGSKGTLVTLSAMASTAYQIAVDGHDGVSGSMSLSVAAKPPTNDDFASAANVPALPFTQTGANTFGTRESYEPRHAANAGGASLWWSWTAPATADVTISTSGSDFDTLLAVYTDSGYWYPAVSSLTEVVSHDDFGGAKTSQVTFNAQAYTTYRIALDGHGGATGNYALSIAWTYKAAAPTFSPQPGIYVGPQSVSMACATSGATIYYWTTPTRPSSPTAYSSPVQVKTPTTLHAYAVKSGMQDSDEVSATYIIAKLTIAPNANTSVPVSGEPVQFTCVVDPSDLSLIWDFGDGTTAGSANGVATHTYTAPGTYTVTVSLLNADGSTAVLTPFPVTVKKAGPPDGPSYSDVDTDGDGFPNEIEAVLGTSPTDIMDRPFPSPLGSDSSPLTLLKLAISLNFKSIGKDAITLSGTLPIPEGFDAAGQPAVVDVGGIVKIFTLDRKGLSKTPTDSFKLAMKTTHGMVTLQDAKFAVKLSKGSFASLLADEGLEDKTAKNEQHSVPVIILFEQAVFRANTPQLYTATAGKSGKARL